MKRRITSWILASGVLAACLVLASCGSDYSPPTLPATGLPAEPLGQVIDLEISLPNLRIMGARTHGIDLELRIEIDDVGFGRFNARVVPVRARVDQRSATVEDLSDGRIQILISPTDWKPDMIGPLRVEGTLFDLILDGTPERGGFKVAGRSWESQTGFTDTFEGWRRHRFLLTATDFFSSTGHVTEVAWVKEREFAVRDRVELVSSDATVRVTNRSVFAINRFTFDNLQRLDPESDFATSWQAGVGPGSNPQDVVMLSEERGYVTRYEPPFNDVAVFDPRRGTVLDSIPLGELAENQDATPRASQMRRADGFVFVGLQDIDRTFTRYGEGKLAVIDPELDEVVGVIPLGGKNPGTIDRIQGADGRSRLYVALSGLFPGLVPRELSGGVFVVDVTNRAVERIALDDDDAGGNIGALAMVSEALGYVVVSDEAFRNVLIAFDPAEATVLRQVLETSDLIPEIEVDSGGILAVPRRSFIAPGLCLYSVPAGPSGTERMIGCAATQLPPFSIEALD